MSHCKPNLEYYREICRILDTEPENCLMVGNDPVNDMVVSKIGMKPSWCSTAGRAAFRSTRDQAPCGREDFQPDFQGLLKM
jgi:FMN phosphatase YigB (HAD superfamily)